MVRNKLAHVRPKTPRTDKSQSWLTASAGMANRVAPYDPTVYVRAARSDGNNNLATSLDRRIRTSIDRSILSLYGSVRIVDYDRATDPIMPLV